MTKLFTAFLFLALMAGAQNKQNIFSDAGDAAKMALAKQKLYAQEYVSAMNLYREVEKNNPENAVVHYYLGLCYFNMNQVANAKTSLLKAVQGKEIVPESHYLLARIYQGEENFDTAIESLTKYQAYTDAEKETLAESKVVLSQCNNAKTLLSQPLGVKISNLGEVINSKYDDKNPCITADGKKLIFTTRRPENTNSPVDVEGDGKHFESIYISALDSLGNYGKAAPVSNAINIKAHDACTGVSADGKQIFIYYNDASDIKLRGGNIFVSKVNNGKWRSPEPLGKPVNTSYWEGGACISPDGKKLFFFSERPEGYGRSDIWMSEKISKTEWGKPVNLGPEINSPNDEGGVFLAPDGKTLFFCSNGANSMGGYDIFRTVYENGKWSSPVNLGYPINTASREGQITISADARYAYFSSDRKGGLGENDIYMVDLMDYAILEKDGKKKNSNGLGIVRGTIREGFEGYGIPDVEVTIMDAQGTLLSSTSTNENGEYFFTLPGGKYKLNVKKKGYQEISEDIELTRSEKETIVLEKGYLIKKS